MYVHTHIMLIHKKYHPHHISLKLQSHFAHKLHQNTSSLTHILVQPLYIIVNNDALKMDVYRTLIMLYNELSVAILHFDHSHQYP